ncbi:AAA family ATPase [Viridibacillus arvi]|uniref:AAA family ATPase n=1 Tax=Viridibacillus arvi TaxID=263475 RepID=UPI003CFF8DE1
MKLKSLNVGNFLNFERVSIDLTNQNVVFGMNDVSKTNLLFAIRFLLDRVIRKNGYRESDYFKNVIDRVIRIT